ncbi:uncharacterized protein LOC123504015 [Portunus trituberculatus]|uniref:uncharacterized protein LOC123504015 n=1 Tax=Portunus trituberculatus TaxID=210409 RepID=UPI001E1CE31E|nr:uncharacterized protein LOC123504015 [Portunus trituberculatus]
MMDNAAASPAADAWHPGPQCAGDGGGGKTENSASEQQTQAHRSFNARPVKPLPRYTTPANMRTLLALAVIATVMGSGLAIKCYECNSHIDKDCATLPAEKAETFLKECGDQDNGEKYNLCRKLDMYLDMDFGEKHPAENRIHRDCGYMEKEETKDESSSCYYKSGYNTRTWVCSCKEDGCNPASMPSVAAFLLPLPALVAVLRGLY